MAALITENGGRGASSCIFARHAVDYAEQGLHVFPVGGETGKKPLVKNWRKFRVNTWQNVADRFANANIGFLNGEGDNPVSIVDVDDSKLFHSALDMFGETPIVIRTPRGGYHLWYKSDNEKRQIHVHGLKIDILGKGGLAVAPPSYRPKKGCYAFIEGDVMDIPRLPKMKPYAPLIQAQSANTDVGVRNKKLFDYCRGIAKDCLTETEISNAAINHNKNFIPPLPLDEVQRVTAQIWAYKTSGRLLNKGDNKMSIDLELLCLSGTPDALTLLLNLLHNHGARKSSFAIDQERMKEKLGWGDRRRVSNAIQVLRQSSKLEQLGKGGNTGRAYQYRLLI